MDGLLRDLRYAARRLVSSPGFSSVASLSLALAIGASTAIFSVVDAVLLRPLPYAQPERRVMIWSRWKRFDKTWVNAYETRSYLERCRSLRDAAFWSTGHATLSAGDGAVRVAVGFVRSNLFSVLGASPVLGRGFNPEEDRPGGPPVVILGYELWRIRFGADRRVIGRKVDVDGVPHEVVGVMPEGFALPTDLGEDLAEPTQALLPRAPQPDEFSPRYGSHGDYAAGVLAPGASVERLNSELRAATRAMTAAGDYPREMEFQAFAVALPDEIEGPHRLALALVVGGAVCLLLIACANVASLLLARGEVRQRELAVRAALGAGRRRLVRQLLAEGLLLALVSALAGLPLSGLGLALLRGLGPMLLPRAASATIDLRAFAFAVGLAAVTTLVFGLLPALRASRASVAQVLRDGGPRSVGGVSVRRWLRALVAAETAFAVVLAVGAGLMLRTLRNLEGLDLGFEPRGVLTLGLSLPQQGYPGADAVSGFYAEVLRAVRALPGVQAAGLLRSLPLGQTIGDWGLEIEGHPAAYGPSADWQVATGGAAEAMGERLLRGRFLNDADLAEGLQVAVINEAMASKYWPGEDPLGRRFRMGRSADRPLLTVVGVVGDIRHNGLLGPVKPKFYRPHAQFPLSSGNPARNMTLVVRCAGDPLLLAGPIREALRRLDPGVPLSHVRTMQEVVASASAVPRFAAALLEAFGGLALLLAALGVHGVLSYAVSERTAEIGVRVALGADARAIVRLVLLECQAVVAAGAASGAILSLGLGRAMRGLLYGVGPSDPATLAGASLALLSVGLASALLPSWRASRVDPVVALRVP